MTTSTNPLAKIFNLVVPRQVEALNQELLATASTVNGGLPPEKHWQAIERLLKRGADINAQDKEGNTVLNLLCDRGNVFCGMRLLERGAQLGPANSAGMTPFLTAARTGDPALLQAFLDRGVDRDERNPQKENAINILLGYVPQHISKEGPQTERRMKSLKLLIDAGVPLEKNMKMRIYAVTTDYIPVVPEIARVKDMKDACDAQDADRLRVFISEGTHPDTTADFGEQSVLAFAAGIGNIPLMAAALDAGAKIDLTSGNQHATALQWAVVQGQREAFAWLLDHGANPEQKSSRFLDKPLYEAARASQDKTMWSFVVDQVVGRNKGNMALQKDVQVMKLKLKKPRS